MLDTIIVESQFYASDIKIFIRNKFLIKTHQLGMASRRDADAGNHQTKHPRDANGYTDQYRRPLLINTKEQTAIQC